MAEQVVTITGVFKNHGQSTKGPWTRYDVKDAGGNKYQTFNDALGAKAEAHKGQSVKVVYHEEARGEYTNNVLDGIEAAGAVNAEAPKSAASQDEFRRSKEEMRRTESIKAAATLLASPKWEGQVDIDTLEIVAGAIQTVIAGEQAAEPAKF